MPGLVTKRFKFHNATQLYESFSEASPNYYYVYIGRLQEWPSSDTAPAPTDTVQDSQYAPWRDMIAAKKVTTTDVSYVVPRHVWTTGTVYTQYTDDNTSLYTSNFYVITSDYNVYKCLFNNDSTTSTVEPTGTSSSILETADGYIWKYMYTITAAESTRFLTENYIPVKTLAADDGSAQWDVQQAAVNGSIEIVRVTSNGSGYVTNSNTFVNVANSTVFKLANTASASDDIYNGSVLFISSGLGSGQLREIVNYVAANNTLTVNTGFTTTPNTSSEYIVSPKITFNGDGTGATAYANVASGEIRKITMINVGSNYSYANAVVTANSGSSAVIKPIISPESGHGSDAVKELGGYNVMLNVKLTGTESGRFPANNNFRSIGLMVDPLLANSQSATSTRYSQMTKLTLTGVSITPFEEDEMISGGTSSAIGRVVNFANSNASGSEGVLSLTNIQGTFTAETITGNTSSATATVSSVTAPDLKPYTGNIIYRENRSLVNRDSDQTEDIKLTVRF